MASLDRNLRKDLENAVKKARGAAEAGARQSIEQLAVQNHEPWGSLSPTQRQLRNRLRAHGRQLGDRRDDRKGTQAIDRLVGECAYEHWHRLLFARFLAENDLLVEPMSGVPVSLDECRELARERGVDWLVLASEFAQRMLPQIFRLGDPVLEVTLPPERRQELEGLLEALPRNVFVADDSLGWVYQFWQAEQKDAVNSSGVKIGAEQLPAVTQLFTESYMVLFLLHNTLGAWWANKVLAASPEIARRAASESELRAACSLPGVSWEYLRFVPDAERQWRVAAGSFNSWPTNAKEIIVLDPCMGSGHFLVSALRILVEFRRKEEQLSPADACSAVLRENVFGLEVDPRCTQIAAFNLAFSAWILGGYKVLPPLNIACSGLGLNAKKDEWLRLAGTADRLRRGMEDLYQLFQKAPDLGSLINPRALEGDLLVAEFRELQPLLEQAVAQEADDAARNELAVVARGVAKAADVLSRQFTLVCTNVPYLGRGKQDSVLKDYSESVHPDAKADLATCFIERCLDFCATGGSVALVTPQNWLFLGTYEKLRRRLLQREELSCIARLGPNAFRDMNWWAATTAMVSLTRRQHPSDHLIAGFDVADVHEPEDKADALRERAAVFLAQRAQLENPDARVSLGEGVDLPLLANYADSFVGLQNGDTERFVFHFWEVPSLSDVWEFFQLTSDTTTYHHGRDGLLRWERGAGALVSAESARVQQGREAWGKRGVAIRHMGNLPATLYDGNLYDQSSAVIVPRDAGHLAPIWAFCSSSDFNSAVRELDQSLKVTNATLVKVPFDLTHWDKVAAERYPRGLPKPHSDDPTQWLFRGHPQGAHHSLQVAVGRLLGYAWPRQTGSSFPDCPALGADGLERHADENGIVCLASLRGESSAADRLRALLADALCTEWSVATQNILLASVGFAGRSLEDWLLDGYFEQHCELFEQRPFIWHFWDGLRNGFGALVNYHKLAGPKGEGRRTLEKLIYTYLGDWIDRQRDDQKHGVEGADGRVAAADHLKRELEKVLEGEPPHDLFVRWKPIDKQPVGWEPDFEDGVRINIRPFMKAKPLNARGKSGCILRVPPKIKWDKDRGKESGRPKAEYPWFWGWDEQTEDFLGGEKFDGNRWNDLHYSRAAKVAARERIKAGEKS